MKPKLKHFLLLLICSGLVSLLIYAFLPKPIQVDLARAERGYMRVTVDEEGRTRIHDSFVVASPVAGRLSRIGLEEGDSVKTRMVIARIDPLPLDTRERSELRSKVGVAEANYREARERIEQSRAELEQARREQERAEELAKKGLISRQSLEIAEKEMAIKTKEFDGAKFRAQAAAFEIEIAKAGLIAFEPVESDLSKTINLYSPVRGKVLRVFEKSERVVTAGTPLLELGDPSKIEIVLDILSADAVKIKEGTPVIIEGWGGERPIKAIVRLVEPSGFTKVSALGIEEQRVNVIADLLESPGSLGNGYRVEARIVIWEGENILKVPLSALFRHRNGWGLFVIENGRARRREVETGQRNQFEAEIKSGLSEGEEIILYPTSQLQEGSLINHKDTKDTKDTKGN